MLKSPMQTNWTDTAETLAPDKGAYALWLILTKPAPLPPGRFKQESLAPGHYLYLGSAKGPGGIKARCARHFRDDKKCHWQIDWLTVQASTIRAAAFPDGEECTLTQRLLKAKGISIPVPGFGSTDCRTCPTHLVQARKYLKGSDLIRLLIGQ